MSRRLCKLDRREIASSLENIELLVRTPAFLCRACARSSSDAGSLCRPEALPCPVTDQPASASVTVLPVRGRKSKKMRKLLKKQARLNAKMKKTEKKLLRVEQKIRSRQSG